MPCFNEIKGYRCTDGTVRATKTANAYVDTMVRIPCGQCQGCRLEKSRQWAIRIMHETSLYRPEECWFLTLTYDEENLPEGNSLRPEDWVKFAKRWRKNRGKFRYYQIGEYGDKGGRPHHHACVFGMRLETLTGLGKTRKGNVQWTDQHLESCWGKGRTSVGSLTWQSASYVTRYILNKQTGDRAKEHYTTLDVDTGEVSEVLPEYATMSRRPGIGRGWIEANLEDVYPRDLVPIGPAKTGRSLKYYDNYLESLKTGSAPEAAPRFEQYVDALKSKRRRFAQDWNRKNRKRLPVMEKIVALRKGEKGRDGC